MRAMTGRSLWSRIEPIADELSVQASLAETFRCLETRIELTELTELTELVELLGCQGVRVNTTEYWHSLTAAVGFEESVAGSIGESEEY
jgi:hypothetical protein